MLSEERHGPGDGASQLPVTADEVLARVTSAGGRLVLSGLGRVEMAEWQHASKIAYLRLLRAGRTRLSRCLGGAPGTYVLRLEEVAASNPDPDLGIGHDDGEEDVRYEDREFLHDPPEPRRDRPDFSARSVRAPSTLPAKPHPLVEQMRQGIAILRQQEFVRDRWSRQSVEPWVPRVVLQKAGRVLRIWQAMLTEAGARGYEIHEPGWRDDKAISLVVEGEEYPIRIGGSKDGLWLRLGNAPVRSRTGNWADRPAEPLERQLDQVFARIEHMAQDKLDGKWREHQEYLQRRVMWRIAMREARIVFADDFRLRALHRRVAEMAQAQRIRAYTRALRDRALQLDDDRRAGSLAWAEWAAKYADSIDTVRQLAGMPDVPEPELEQLKPFLVGWSPFGPYR